MPSGRPRWPERKTRGAKQDDMTADDRPLPFGISEKTGRPLAGLSDEILDALGALEARRTDERALATKKAGDAERAAFAVTDVEDANDLGETGWGVVFAADADPGLETALGPLLEHRQKSAKGLFKIFKGADGYRKGESAAAWLERHDVSLNPVSPTMGVPFYLLLVGSPQDIPLEFQYTLDIYWAVGRLYFDDRGGYVRYA